MPKSKSNKAHHRARQIISSQSQSQSQSQEEAVATSDNKMGGAGPNADEEDEDFSTQGFVVRDSESEDQLWSVIEIINEKKGSFLVKWAGVDDNGNPWEDSWIPREDVTDDLVVEWREKKARKKKEKEKKKKADAAKRGRASSEISSSAAKPSSSSTTMASTSAVDKRKGSRILSSAASAVTPTSKKSKRKHISASIVGDTDSEDEPPPKRQKSTSTGSEPVSERSSVLKQKEGKGKQNASSEGTPDSPPSSRLRKRKSDVTNYLQKKPTTPSPSQNRPSGPDKKWKQMGEQNGPFDLISSSSLRHRIFPIEDRDDDDDFASAFAEASKPISNGKDNVKRSSHSASGSPPPSAKSRKEPASVPINYHDSFPSSSLVRKRTLDAEDELKRGRGNSKKGNGVNAISPVQQYNRDPTPPRRSFKTSSNATSLERRKYVQSDPSSSSQAHLGASSSRLAINVDMRSMPEEGDEEEPLNDEDMPDTLKDSAHANEIQSQTNSLDSLQPKRLEGRKRTYTKSSTRPSDEEAAVDFDLLGDAEDYTPGPKGEDPLFLPETHDERMRALRPNGNETQIFGRRSRSHSLEFIVPASLSQSLSQSQSGLRHDSQSQEHAQSENGIDQNNDSRLAQFGSSLPAHERENAQARDSAALSQFINTVGTFETSLSSDPGNDPRLMKQKELKKLPQISPSKFVPYLPARHKRLSALPAPFISRALNDATEPTSSIEMSQESHRDRARRRSSGRSTNDDVVEVDDDSDIDTSMRRSLEQKQDALRSVEGMRLTEQGKREKQKPGDQLQAILEGINGQIASNGVDHDAGPSIPAGDGKDVTHVSTSQPSVLPSSFLPRQSSLSEQPVPRRTSTPPEDRRVRQFEHDFLNLDGADDFQNMGEETYDDGSRKVALDDPIVAPDCVDSSRSSGDDTGPRNQPSDDEDFEEEEVIAASESEGGQEGTETTSSQSAYVDDDEHFYPYRTQFKIVGSPKKFDDTPISPLTQTPTQALAQATEHYRKSLEYIDKLQGDLAASERERINLESKIAEIAAEKAVVERALLDRDELEAVNGTSTAVDDTANETLVSVTKEKEALVAEVALLKASNEDLSKDLGVFRDVYGNACSYADEIQRELAEYKERATLAESQVTNGVALVRRAAKAAEEKITSELHRVKGQLHILSTRDNRTDDEVRQKAALEPGLRTRITALENKLEESEATTARVLHQRNELYVSNHELQEQIDNLRLDQETRERLSEDRINELEIQVAWLEARERVVQSAFDLEGESGMRGEDAMVFVCEWVVHGRQCGVEFETVQELQDHVLTANSHVRRPSLQVQV